MTSRSTMDPETLTMVLDTISKLEKDRLPLEKKLEMDWEGEFPMDLIRFMSGPEVGLHLIFVPGEFGGLYRVGQAAERRIRVRRFSHISFKP